jgi:hypothetical protein
MLWSPTSNETAEPDPPPAATRRRSGWRGLSPNVAVLVTLALITALAFAARVFRLGAVGFRGDEAVYAGQAGLLADAPGMGRFFIPASRGNSNFLVYQWIVSLVYRVFGVSDYSARLVSAVFSTLTVVLVFLIAALLYDRRTALLSALLLAISGYAIGLGRLALLDTTACFFITLAMYFLVRWTTSERSGWLFAFAAAAAVAVEAKVTSVLLLPIALLFVVCGGYWRRVRLRHLIGVIAIGVVCLTPAAIQIALDSGRLRSYLSASVARTSGVPWSYYGGIVWSAEGAVVSIVLLAGIVVALVRHTRADLLPLLWFGGYAVFCQVYPLKAFNYLLPLIPPLVLLAGRALSWLVSLADVRFAVKSVVVATVAAVALIAVQAPATGRAMRDDSDAGMREAARWLQAHDAQRAGAMTLSHGSGQYVLSFYGGVDAYPFGRFRIATVVPGGRVVQATPRSGGGVPLDWVDYWPARLVEENRVSYLVYNTRPLDDPPEEDQVAGTFTERQFRSLIAAFGGKLVHTVHWRHEARVYVYRITKRLPRPVVTVLPADNALLVRAAGFVIGSPLTVTYHRSVVARATADADGKATIKLPIPDPGQREYHLTVSDQAGNSAAVTGLVATKLVYTVRAGVVHVAGSGYQPSSEVRFSYGSKAIGTSMARADGTVAFAFRLPVLTHQRFRIQAIDERGRAASAIGLAPPEIAFTATKSRVDVTGRYYFPRSKVTLTYRQQVVGTVETDAQGSFRFSFDLPRYAQPTYQLVGADALGRTSSVTGLVRP